MGSEQVHGTAIITFVSAGEAERRIAGVAAAARIVREVAEAGVAEAWLVIPGNGDLRASTEDDLRRLAGDVDFRVVRDASSAVPSWEDERNLVHLPGNRLVPAHAISRLLAGELTGLGNGGIRLDARNAAAEVLKGTGKAGDGPVSRWLNRPLSRRMSALLVRVPGVRPIHATVGTAALALLMFAALVGGGATALIAGGLLFQAASIFDGVDGELARATFRTSRAGAVLDSIVDVATNILFIFGLTINLALHGEERALPLMVWGFTLFVLGLVTIAWRAARSRGHFSLNFVKHHYRQRFPGPPIRWLISFFTVVSSRDFFALLFAVLVVAGLPMAVLYLFAAAATVWILFVAGSLRLPRNAVLASPGA